MVNAILNKQSDKITETKKNFDIIIKRKNNVKQL